MKTRPLSIALSAFAATAGLVTLLGVLFAEDTLHPLMLFCILLSGGLLLVGAVALFQQKRIAAPLLLASAVFYGVLGIYEPVIHGLAEATPEFYASLGVRLAVAAAAFFLVRRGGGDPA